MKRAYWMLWGVWALGACSAEEGTMLEIIQVPAPENDCTFAAETDLFRPSASFDPVIARGGSTIMAMNLVNHLNEDLGNDLSFVGFDVCWFRGDQQAVVAFEGHAEGYAVQCDDKSVSARQKAFIPTSGHISSGGGTAVTSINVLPRSALQALYGDELNPSAIPFGDDPTVETRSAAWGNYPYSRYSSVIVRARAQAKTPVGDTIRSNWFQFPFELCMDCFASYCAPQVIDVGESCLIEQGWDIACTDPP